MEKIEIYCDQCDASYKVIHDLDYPYDMLYCVFCGSAMDYDNIDTEDNYNDEF